jgi:hypothetical protein
MGKPDWLEFNTTTGHLSGTPDNTDIETTTGIVISVSDGKRKMCVVSGAVTVE